MSKSYGNTIGIFDEGKALKKKVMSIVTDSHPLDEPKDPDADNVFALIKLFADDASARRSPPRTEPAATATATPRKSSSALVSDHFAQARERRRRARRAPRPRPRRSSRDGAEQRAPAPSEVMAPSATPSVS